MDSLNWFEGVKQAPAIEVFKLTADFNEDTNPQKANLGVGAFRDDDSKPWVLPVVRQVEKQMAEDPTLNHEYLPVAGNETYRTATVKLLLGDDSPAITECRADGMQALGGTGALFIGLKFLKKLLGIDVVYVSTPTWGNHKGLSTSIGYSSVREYRYWDNARRKLDIDGMIEDLRAAPERAVVILHSCCHNPTGVDPTREEWERIASVVRERKLFPFFDCAYQGFSCGDLDVDAWAVRYFVREGFELFAAQSFSKNFGLYNERVGNLCFVASDSQRLAAIRSQMVMIVRQTWSNSPNHGSRIVATVLGNDSMRTEWMEHVKTMAERILLMRQMLYEKLKALGTPGTWEHITQQKGMFSYTGLSADQVEYMIKKHHIYLMKSGRINMCGLTTKNVEYVAGCIHDAVTNVSVNLQSSI